MNARVAGIGILIFILGLYTPGLTVVPGQNQKLAPPAPTGAANGPSPLGGTPPAGAVTSARPLPSRAPKPSPILSETNEASFQELLKVYRAKELNKALTEVKRLQNQKGAADEIATYLLGEIYLKQAEEGVKEAIPQAMAFFKKAVATYPKSGHVLFGHIRIGEIYARQRLFYEAIGSFNRVVDWPSQSPFQWKAQIEIARAYQAWGKWEKAKEAYEGVLRTRSFSAEEKAEVQLGYADALYQTGQFEEAYQLYKRAASVIPAYRFKDPIALFQFGETAYRAGHFPQAKRLFLSFYNIYPKEPFAPVALVRFGTLLKREEAGLQSTSPLVTPNRPSIDDTIDRLASKLRQTASNEPADLSQILLSIKALKECARRAPFAMGVSLAKGASGAGVDSQKPEVEALFFPDDFIPCNLPLAEEAFLRSPTWSEPVRQEIRTRAMSLLATPLPSTTAQGMLLEAVDQLKKYKDIEAVMEIEAALLLNLPPASPYRQEIQENLNKTIVTELGTLHNPMTVVTLFHRYPSAFTKKMLAGDVGFVIAASHAQVGLLSRAAELFLPIAKNFRHPSSDEALYQIGTIYLQLGDYVRAQRALEQYRHRSPQGLRALADLGDIHFKQGEIETAILFYEYWLSRYPKHPKQKEIYLKLSEAHRYRNDFDNEIKVYLRWIRGSGEEETGLPYARLADAYFQSGQYQKAVDSYQWIINHSQQIQSPQGPYPPLDSQSSQDSQRSYPEKKWTKEVEWAQLRLAMSYESLGQHEAGKRLFKKIVKKAKNPLIKKMAEDKVSTS